MFWLRQALARVAELLRFLTGGRGKAQPAVPPSRPATETPIPPIPYSATHNAVRVLETQSHDAQPFARGSVENIVIEPVVEHIHESYVPLQKQAIRAVFQKLGIPYTPDFLLSLLREYDARYALFRFCAIWKVPYGPLMDPTAPDHASASEGLRCAVGFLVGVEQTANHSRLDPGPIYDALNRSTEEAESLLGQLRRVSHVAATIRGVHLTFELVKRLAETTLARLRPWNLVNEAELLRAEKLALKLREYEAQFGQADSRIQEALKRIGALGNRLKYGSKKEYESLLGRRGEILRDLGAGCEFEAKLKDLGRLADLFSDLAKRVSSDVRSEQWSHPGKFTLAEARAILGVQISASFAEIRSAYRRLALQFHPDRCPGDPSAKEKFQRISAAYHYITDNFARGVA
jgi:hypothetical protein